VSEFFIRRGCRRQRAALAAPLVLTGRTHFWLAVVHEPVAIRTVAVTRVHAFVLAALDPLLLDGNRDGDCLEGHPLARRRADRVRVGTFSVCHCEVSGVVCTGCIERG